MTLSLKKCTTWQECIMWQKCLYFYCKEGSWHRTENLLLFQAIQLVHMKPRENEHIRTAPCQLSDSWDKGKCLIAAFQTKSTQLRTRVRVKKVLKRNITAQQWLKNIEISCRTLSSFSDPSEGKNIPQHFLPPDLSNLEPHQLWCWTSLCWFSI